MDVDFSRQSTKVVVTIAALIGIIVPALGGLIFMENRYAHKLELAQIEIDHQKELKDQQIEFEGRLRDVVRTLELRDNLNFLESSKKQIEGRIKTITSAINMYEQNITNDGLTPSQRARLSSLERELADEQRELTSITRAMETIRMSISPL